ncbi:MAG: hypothetical protein J1E41_04175 [Ruminococcus sp.]|nr:hypothetical protein [Ruminococcus sp.]
MKKFARIFSVFVALIIALGSFGLTAFAQDTSYEIDELNMSISIPNDMLAFTRNSEKTDPFISKFGLNYEETVNNFKSGNIYLQAMKEDGSLTLTVTMTKDENSEKINNYAKLSDAEIKDVMNKYLSDTAYKSGSVVEHNNVKYIYLTMSTKSGKKIIQAEQYGTVINGMNIIVTLDAPAGEKLTSNDKELFTSVIEQTKILEDNFFVKHQDYIVYASATLFGLIIVAVVLVVLLRHFKNPDRKHRHLVHELAHEHRISETTKIPRKSILDITKPTMSFMKNYAPIEEIGKETKSEKKTVREVPLAEKIVANNTRTTSEPVEEIPIAKPMEFKDEEIEEKPIADNDELVQDVAEESFGQVDDYFDEVPEEENMYSYSDVDTAVDEYSAAKEESRRIREDRRESAETARRVFSAIGRGILTVLQCIWMVIAFIIIHCKYFCINLYRMIKKNHARKKRMRIEEERRREASERRRIQREAERARQLRNANRGENDLVKVRSSSQGRPVRTTTYPRSGQRTGTPSNRRPQPRDRRY